jgi:hypothetical protein
VRGSKRSRRISTQQTESPRHKNGALRKNGNLRDGRGIPIQKVPNFAHEINRGEGLSQKRVAGGSSGWAAAKKVETNLRTPEVSPRKKAVGENDSSHFSVGELQRKVRGGKLTPCRSFSCPYFRKV